MNEIIVTTSQPLIHTRFKDSLAITLQGRLVPEHRAAPRRDVETFTLIVTREQARELAAYIAAEEL